MKKNNKITIFWFRQDLRISDNPGLFEAAKNSLVMPIYIFNPNVSQDYKVSGASGWWLHNSLNDLNNNLGKKLNLYIGNPYEVILKLIERHNIEAIFWNRCYDPSSIAEDAKIKNMLKSKEIECHSYNASLLREPWEVLKDDDTPYKIYTSFYKKGYAKDCHPRSPLGRPNKLELAKDLDNKTIIDDLKLLSEHQWYKKLESQWSIGENAAQGKLALFMDDSIKGYKTNRNYPSMLATSRLSPHLHFGEISPNQIWHRAWNSLKARNYENDLECFISEIVWREFAYYLLYHFPNMNNDNLQSKFNKFSWKKDITLLSAWKKGMTGYPIIDAGMRELWQTGYMHNRVRMIVASFLVKNLLIHWHEGRDWFWDCLVDADIANNSLNWQWVSGTGVDFAPYFRIFNPVLQGEKFDPEGIYTRKYVPELKDLPNKYLFKPYEAPSNILASAGIILGKTYPMPIVDLKSSSKMALEEYKRISK